MYNSESTMLQFPAGRLALGALWALALAHFASAEEVCAGPNYSGPVMMVVGRQDLQGGDFRGFQREGVSFQFGEEAQTLAMEVNLLRDDTVLYDDEGFGNQPGACNPQATADMCRFDRGGFYNRGDSWKENSPAALNIMNGTDTLTFANTKVPDFPLTVVNRAITTMNSLGLGPDSAILERMKEDGIIASKSFSLWWGQLDGEGQESGGHLIFGGEDESKIEAPGVTLPIAPVDPQDCYSGLVVNIRQIVAAVQPGQESPVMNAATDFCITPDLPLMFLPENTIRGIATMIDSPPAEPPSDAGLLGMRGPVFNNDVAWNGNIIFDIVDGNGAAQQFDFPAEQISVPAVVVNDETGFYESSESQTEILLGSAQPNSGRMPRLGYPFLRSVVLTVNREDNTFTLSRPSNNGDSKLRAIVKQGDTCTPGEGPADDGTPPTEPAASSGGRSGPRPELIGAAVGSIVGFLIILALAIFLVRKQVQAKRARERGYDEKREQAMQRQKAQSFSLPLQGTPVKYCTCDQNKGEGGRGTYSAYDALELDAVKRSAQLLGSSPQRNGSQDKYIPITAPPIAMAK